MTELEKQDLEKFAHDIRNYLAVVTCALELARSSPDIPSRTKALGHVGAVCRRCRALLGNLLELAPPQGPLSLADELLEIVEAFRATQPSTIHFITNIETRLGSVGDSLREALPRILLNLIKNACEAMAPVGGILKIAATAETGDDSKPRLRVTVYDNGPGIPPETQARLFQTGTTTKRDGSGLGLAASKQLLEQHGGQISFASKPGEGTEFTVIVPTA